MGSWTRSRWAGESEAPLGLFVGHFTCRKHMPLQLSQDWLHCLALVWHSQLLLDMPCLLKLLWRMAWVEKRLLLATRDQCKKPCCCVLLPQNSVS